jgi:uncharacterized phage-like protein YoqJ
MILGIAIQSYIPYCKNPNQYLDRFIEAETEIIRDQIINNNVDTILLNGEIELDREVFDLVYGLKVREFSHLKIQLVLPYRSREDTLQLENKKRIKKHIKLSDELIYVDELDGYKTVMFGGTYNSEKILNMNKYIIENCDVFNTMWNRKKDHIYSYIKYAADDDKKIVIYDNKNQDIIFY